jgi:hypothetical protein
MLHEFEKVRQRPNEGFRRFFSDDNFELMVWYDSSKKNITGFQIVYDLKWKERVITFKTDEGKIVKSHRYNTGNYYEVHGSDSSSILSGDPGEIDIEFIRRLLVAILTIDKEIQEYIKNTLKRQFKVFENILL